MNLSIRNQLYQCTCRPFCCSAWCYYASFDYLFKLGKVVCSNQMNYVNGKKKLKTTRKR